MDEPIEFRTLIKIIVISIGLLCILAYFIFQARFLIMGPQITLTEHLNVRQNERAVFLTGMTRNISHLWLNDRPIYTDRDGEFKEALILENGYTIATLRAEDRYGRKTTIIQPLVYTPASFK